MALQPDLPSSLQNLILTSKDQSEEIKATKFALPSINSIVAEARRTVKATPIVPSQTQDDKDRVMFLRGLKGMVEKLEHQVEADIAQAANNAQDSVNDYQLFGTSAVNYEDAKAELVEIQEKGVKTYLKLVATERVENSKRLREHSLRHKLQQDHMEEHFSWYPRYVELVNRINAKPHSNRWRGHLSDLVRAFEQYARIPILDGGLGFPKVPVKDKTGNTAVGSDVPLFLRNFLRDVNSYNERQAENKLKELLNKLLDVEACKDANFKVIRDKGANAEKNLEMIHRNRMKKSALLNRTHRSKVGEESSDFDSEDNTPTPASMALSLVADKRNDALEKLKKSKELLTKPEPIKLKSDKDVTTAVSRMLFEVSVLPAMRGNDGKLAAEYHQILVYCAQQGHWKGALKVYEALGRRHIPATFPSTFITMMLTFKNAKPRPKSELVLPLIDEAEACGFALTREFYHSAMDVFRAAGHWRRAISVFNRMGASGINPTTHTYSLLEKSGAAAKNADPSEVYSALTYAGVPAYLSYTAATACAQKRRPTDNGPIADWLGKDA